MNKYLKFAIVFAFTLILSGINSFAGDNLLNGRKWTKHAALGSTSKGNLQGAAFLPSSLNGIDHKDRIYVFKQRPADTSKGLTYGNSYDYYEPSTNSWHKGEELFTWAPQTHMGSATFGPSVISSYTGSDGNVYHCTIPFVYVSGHAFLDANGAIVASGTTGAKKHITSVVLDLENKRIVKVFSFPERSDDCIISYDFTGRRIWVIGYVTTQGTGISPYVIDEYRRIDMTDFLSGNPSRWNYSDIDRQTVVLNPDGGTNSSFSIPSDGSPYCLSMQGGGPGDDNIQTTLECGTVQDVFYYEDRLYIVTGRGSLYNRTEHVKIHSYYVGERKHNYDKTIVTCLHGESQGLVFDGVNIWMTLNANNVGETGLYKYAPRNGDNAYDDLNTKEAGEVTPATNPATYNITDGYELAWFLDQVYAGRTKINAVLANDIDMSGIKLPTSYYIYDKTKKFEAQYAFRGTFDGQGHTISNLSINSTPFNNDGLFPWIIDATIKDFAISGNITLSKAENNNSGYGVENVGLIGTAEGNCTITGINLSDFGISNPSSLSTNNVNPLIGNDETTSSSNISGNTVKTDHQSDGVHQYNENGICIYIHENQVGMFEPAELLSGVYQIKNAGNLIWFAKSINDGTISSSSNAILTSNINLEGAKHGSFPGIGFVDKTTNIMYTGTFDGNGKKIQNFYMAVTTHTKGLFNVISGSSVVKDFSLEGNMIVSNTTDKYFIGAVVGRVGRTDGGNSADDSPLIEDITSNVNIRVEGNVRSGLGGVVGATMGNKKYITINRCRYNGTITVATTTTYTSGPQGVGGVIGNHRSGEVNNCLFDGTIITTVDDIASGGNLNVGGFAGATSDGGTAIFNNCFSNGELQIQDNTNNHCGIFLGWTINTTTITNCYYTANNIVVSKGDINGDANEKALKVAKTSALTDGTTLYNLQNGAGNWIQGDNYPIPGVGPLAEAPAHTHEYDADGFCIDGDGAMQKPNYDGNSFVIVNRGNLYWFLNYVNGTLAETDPDYGVHTSANAKLATDINLQQKPFEGFNNFAGVFNGDGHTISGFKATYTSGNKHGFFNNTIGASSSKMAEIRGLTLEGEMTVNGSIAFSGAIVGSADNFTIIEDNISKVNITVVSGNERYTGGVLGVLLKNTTTINRCYYSGTITVKESYKSPDSYRQGVGGVVGAARTGTVSNCLFDGTITTEKDNTNVAGILGTASDGKYSIVKNCLSTGTFNLAGNSNGQNAAIFGACHYEQQTGYVKIIDSYAIIDSSSEALDCIGTTEAYSSLVHERTRVGTIYSSWDNATEYAQAMLNSNEWKIIDGKLLPRENAESFIIADEVDSMPLSEINNSEAQQLLYARDNKYMSGMISVCLPFALDQNSLPSPGSKYLKYKGVSKDDNGVDVVIFQEVKAVPAGVPCFIELGSDFTNTYWVVKAERSTFSSDVHNPTYGIKGSFSTKATGTGYYKLNNAGNALLVTKSSSSCYPYRAYIVLPDNTTKASTLLVK